MGIDSTWEAKARDWARFARSPENDHSFWTFNGPRFLEPIPKPGRRTLDLARGEGRLGRPLPERLEVRRVTRAQYINFLKKTGIVAVYLAPFTPGPGSVSLDSWLRSKG